MIKYRQKYSGQNNSVSVAADVACVGETVVMELLVWQFCESIHIQSKYTGIRFIACLCDRSLLVCYIALDNGYHSLCCLSVVFHLIHARNRLERTHLEGSSSQCWERETEKESVICLSPNRFIFLMWQSCLSSLAVANHHGELQWVNIGMTAVLVVVCTEFWQIQSQKRTARGKDSPYSNFLLQSQSRHLTPLCSSAKNRQVNRLWWTDQYSPEELLIVWLLTGPLADVPDTFRRLGSLQLENIKKKKKKKNGL